MHKIRRCWFVLIISEMEARENEEREMKMGSENGERRKNLGGEYSKNRPPEDDCCPICFDDFYFPCRTSCGHWFCFGCIMELWRYRANSKQCKCPICGCLIVNLVLQPSLLIHPGEEFGKILRDIQLYNSMNLGGFSAFLMLLLGIMYEVFELQFFPNGGLGIAIWFDMCIYGVVEFLLWDVSWQRWMMAMRRLL